MLRLSIIPVLILSLVSAACSQIENPVSSYEEKPAILSSFSGSEERQEITAISKQWISKCGYCCEGRTMPFVIMSSNDPRFSGTRIQYDSMYAQSDGTFKLHGSFEWKNEGGSWTGTFSGNLSLDNSANTGNGLNKTYGHEDPATGVVVEMKGYGHGGYSGLYFELNSSHPGDPTTPTGTGTFEGKLYQLPQ